MVVIGCGCSNPSSNDDKAGGTLTIDGLSDWDGKYVFAVENTEEFVAAASYSKKSGITTGAKVNDGSVTLNVFTGDGNEAGSKSDVKFMIFSSASATVSIRDITYEAVFIGDYKVVTVSFSGSSAAGTAEDPEGILKGASGTVNSTMINKPFTCDDYESSWGCDPGEDIINIPLPDNYDPESEVTIGMTVSYNNKNGMGYSSTTTTKTKLHSDGKYYVLFAVKEANMYTKYYISFSS